MIGMKNRAKTFKRNLARICAGIILAGVLGAACYTGFIYYQANHALQKISISKTAAATSHHRNFPTDKVNQPIAKPKSISILLLGIDYRQQTGSLNSDVIMAVTLNPETKSATIVSIPRDMQLHPLGLPARKANYYYPHFFITDKANVFKNTKKVFNDVFGLKFDYMTTFNFKGFEEVVDALNGLMLTVDQDMRYVDSSDGTNINLTKGRQLLDGNQTLDFVRYRKSNRGTANTEETDRNVRQQQVLGQILHKMKSFSGLTKLNSLINAVGDNVQTDIPALEIAEIMKTYYGIDQDKIQFIHLNGDWVSPYIYVKEEDLREARLALHNRL